MYNFRYEQFTRYSLKCRFENLPPSEGVRRQHAYRKYVQLQSWLRHFNYIFRPQFGNESELNPADWVWTISKAELVLVRSSDPLVPDFLLKQITCSCKTGCKMLTCGCIKLGLRCSNLCTECTNKNCENWDVVDTN